MAKRFKEEEIVKTLKEAKALGNVGEVIRGGGMSDMHTYEREIA